MIIPAIKTQSQKSLVSLFLLPDERRAFSMATVLDIPAETRSHKNDPLTCHCFQVGASAIRAAIDAGATEVEQVSEKTSAGLGCGSCRCHIERLLVGLPAECGPCAQCPGCGYVQGRCQCQAA
tara:strand:+ start:359 stop:727 length:369 start_codon:yes stop_codon:yes gene_type:complete